MFMALQIYEESFEKLFLEKTSKYYEEEGRKFMQEMSVIIELLYIFTYPFNRYPNI